MHNITFNKPDPHSEWEEAERYPQIFPTFKHWQNAIAKGKIIDPEAKGLAGHIENTEYEPSLDAMILAYNTLLTKDRIARVDELFSKEHISIDLPIVMHYKGNYELIAGNTRLTKMAILHRQDKHFPVKVFLIEP